MNQVSRNLGNSKKVSLVGVVLGICIIAVILVAYGQISIMQKNTSNLEANNGSLSDQVAALQAEKTSLLSQKAALEQDNTSLQQQVASLQAQATALQSQVAQMKGEKADLNSQIALLKVSIGFYQSFDDTAPKKVIYRAQPQ